MAIEKVCMRAVKMIQATSMSRLYKTQLIVMNHGWGLSGIFGMAIATDTATDFAPVIKRQDTDGGTAMMTTVGDGINEMWNWQAPSRPDIASHLDGSGGV
jgi:hypothetical protein